jgi:hypothetical protein
MGVFFSESECGDEAAFLNESGKNGQGGE